MAIPDSVMKIAKKNKYSNVLSNSNIGKDGYLMNTKVPAVNIALSAKLNGGMKGGILQIVGDSQTFKTGYGLLLMSEYLKEHPDAYALFFDSENGASFDFFDTFGIDKERVIHLPVEDVEDLKIQCNQFLSEIERGDKVFFFVDSLGLLPSRKEMEDAEDGKTVADMTRAKAVTSFWRTVTNKLSLRNLPMVVINHYYSTMSLYPEDIIKGGKASILACNDIWIIQKSKVKDGKEVIGHDFKIKIYKSRSARANSVIPITITYDGGIDKYSGLLEMARATGHITMPKNGWYTRTNVEDDKNWRRTEMDDKFWKPVLEDESFNDKIYSTYSLHGSGTIAGKLEDIMDEIEYDEETGEILN